MPVSQADIDALNTAIAASEKIVRFADGKMVEYHSPSEMIRARNDLLQQMAKQNASAGTVPRIVYHTQGGRGY